MVGPEQFREYTYGSIVSLNRVRCLLYEGKKMINPEWTSCGKTVAKLIEELRTFENQELEVRISIDDGKTSYPISLVGKYENKYALLLNCQDIPTIIDHASRRLK
jgi:hypothetical protein